MLKPAPGSGAAGPPVTPYLGLAVVVVAVSFGAIFARMAGEAPPLVIAAFRVGLAALVLVPLALLRSRRELAKLSLRDGLMAMLAGLFLALHFATWITSLSYTSVTNSVVLVNTNPLWVGLLTPFIARERIPRMAKVSIGVSVLGGAVIGYGDLALGSDALWGDFLALCGGICAAVYLLL
ncbi:MAG TPA: DMT family transporter, partial [Desulfosarcina sp.]|nr:DMT family transporter [Desulfosarcina sp.]